MKVEITNLRKTFGATKAVDNVSFSFESGQVVGFVGPNGAGKTTTMRVLATMEDPTSGDASINGISVTEYPDKVRHLVGFVPDALPVQGDITVHEYLDFFARAYRLHGKKRRKAVEAIEDFTNLTGIKEKLLRDLSKGMKQRVSLGRALIHDPPVLILDEPAAALDPRSRIELRELLHILAQQKKAILISSHILTELTEICNAVVIIERGKLLESGTISDVVKRSKPKQTIIVRPIDRIAELERHLSLQPNIEGVHTAGSEVVFEIEGDDSTGCEILCDLVKHGYKLAEFKHKKTGLEDIFMNITKGGVQ